MALRRSSVFLRRLVRVEGRKVVARFLTRPERAAVMTFPTHGDARRAAAKLVVQLRLAATDEEYDEQLRFRVELVRAYDMLEQEEGGRERPERGAPAIVRAAGPRLLDEARTLFQEYGRSLPIDLTFQRFDEELRSMATMYGPPSGCLLLALDGEEPAGCVAVRRLDAARCEMKRLFVRPSHRGRGTGEALARAAVDEARALGYAAMRLDTLPSMHAAIALYRSLGFRDIAPYYDNPHQAIYMELALLEAEAKGQP